MRFAIPVMAMAAAAASADTTYVFSVSNRVTEVHPSATIELRAVFDENLYALAGAALNVHAAPDAGGFSDPYRLLRGPGTTDGEVSPDGDSVAGIIVGQLCGNIPECPKDTSNPILTWRVTWSTTDFSPRAVDLATETSKFEIYTNQDGTSESFLDSLVEGSGLIEVGCYADCTADGTLDLFDFLCFVNQFNAADPGADCNGSGGLDLFDFLCYQNAFIAGC